MMKLLRALAALLLAAQAAALSIGGKQMHVERESDGLQDIVSDTTIALRLRARISCIID